MNNNNNISTGGAIFLTICMFVIIGAFVSMFGKEDPTCAYPGCDRKVSSEGAYCYQHDTPGKRRHATYGTGSSHYNSTSGSSSSNSSSNSSTSNSSGSSSSSTTSSYNPSSSSSKYNSSHSHNSYDDGYDDVYFDNDYDQKRYDSDDDYATGVDDAIDDDMEDGDEGDW